MNYLIKTLKRAAFYIINPGYLLEIINKEIPHLSSFQLLSIEYDTPKCCISSKSDLNDRIFVASMGCIIKIFTGIDLFYSTAHVLLFIVPTSLTATLD